MFRRLRQKGILRQLAILFAVGVLANGLLTFVLTRTFSGLFVKKQVENRSVEISKEVMLAVREYPASDWLLRYWYDHSEEMDIEYDVGFNTETETFKKCALLSERHPELQIKYADAGQIEELPPEDQKLFAEITYSWLITHVNEIKRTYDVDYLFCVMTEAPYDKQFFLFSAADEGAVRGTEYEEVYTLGKTVTVGESQQNAMLNAMKNGTQMANAGNYVDYYSCLGEVDGHAVLTGLTYSLSGVAKDANDQTRTATGFAVFFQIILSYICLALTSGFVIRPLKKVQKNVILYKETKDSRKVSKNLSEIRMRNEIGDLAKDVVDLTKEIEEHVNRIQVFTAEQERLETELSLAAGIQSAMLPHDYPPFPDRTEFDIYASMKPAKAVGGDLYNYYLIDDDHLCMMIADVSGKGVPASMYMMITTVILQNCAMLCDGPAEILTETNKALCANNQEGMFVTAWVGIVELSTGIMTAANAGHEYPILKTDGEFELLRDKHGFVLGGMETARYTEYTVQLKKGDRVFVYTDGIAEASDAQKKMFGTDRIVEALNSGPDGTAREVLVNVGETVDRFVGDVEQFDDMTMLSFRYDG